MNSLKRQLSAIQELEVEIDTLRSTLSKRNNELSDLKKNVFDNDRSKYEMEGRIREIQTLKEINQLKIR